MNLYQFTPFLALISGLLLGVSFAYWRFQQQKKLLKTLLKRQRITNHQLNEQHQSVSDQLHSLRNAHDRLNSSYNKLYVELEECRNQLRKAYTAQNRYLDRITNQQMAIQELQNLNNSLQKQHIRQPLISKKTGAPVPKSHFSKRVKKQVVQDKTVLSKGKDDLKKVKGIDPDIEKVLNHAGITTWVNLSRANVEELKHLLNQKGEKISTQYDPATWPKQAELALKGRWKELKRWQKRWEEQQVLNNLVK